MLIKRLKQHTDYHKCTLKTWSIASHYLSRKLCTIIIIINLGTQVYGSRFFPLPEKQIDLENVDLRKLKVKELKKILSQWGEECRGCAEKSDYVSKINDIKHLHMEL